jgi:hypothetical protein
MVLSPGFGALLKDKQFFVSSFIKYAENLRKVSKLMPKILQIKTKQTIMQSRCTSFNMTNRQ